MIVIVIIIIIIIITIIIIILFGISETLHCSMSAPYGKIVPLLDVHQLLMLFAGTLTYSEPETFCSVVFSNTVCTDTN
jgi:hypothetical protein